jgi:hypothetical protein
MLSTGTLPPAAVPMTAQSEQNATKFCVPATAQAKMPPIKMVALKAGFRPMISAVVPQKLVVCNRAKAKTRDVGELVRDGRSHG